ncbi:MAG: GGDEF domain-containing protein [Pseudomonadota bacterium]
MQLDAQTLFFSMWASVTLMSAALAIGVGRARPGLRAWNAALLWQSAGWALLIASTVHRESDRLTATLGASALVASVSSMYLAAQYYLHRPPRRAWVWGPPLATLVLHAWVYPYFAARITLVNTVLGVQMLWLAWLLRPWAGTGTRRWRWLAFGALLLSAPMVLARTGLVLWAPESYPTFTSGHWLNVSGLLVNNACLMVGTLAFLLAHRDEAERALHRLATLDGLTGTLNHRSLLERGAEQLQLALRHGQPFTVLMLDLDHFKQINDRHGHPAGDRVLALFAELLLTSVRQGDLVGRYGGEEFCMLLSLSDLDAARAVDRRLRERLVDELNPLVGFEVNFSAGAAMVVTRRETLEQLISRADHALYAAKHAGRGQLVCDVAGGPVQPLPQVV